MSVHDKVKPIYHDIIAAAAQHGVALIIPVMYIVDLPSGETTSMTVMPLNEEYRETII